MCSLLSISGFLPKDGCHHQKEKEMCNQYSLVKLNNLNCIHLGERGEFAHLYLKMKKKILHCTFLSAKYDLGQSNKKLPALI